MLLMTTRRRWKQSRRRRIIPIITTHSLPTEAGSMSRELAVVGSQLSSLRTTAGGLISIVAAGFTPIADGIGCPIIPGVGRRFIMAAGSNTRGSAGAGRPIAFGVRHGFAGGKAVIIVAGLHCLCVRDLLQVSASHFTDVLCEMISLSALARIIFGSFTPVVSWIATLAVTFCHATIRRAFLSTPSLLRGLSTIIIASRTSGFRATMSHQRLTQIFYPSLCAMYRLATVAVFVNDLNGMAAHSPSIGPIRKRELPRDPLASLVTHSLGRIARLPALRVAATSHASNLNRRGLP